MNETIKINNTSELDLINNLEISIPEDIDIYEHPGILIGLLTDLVKEVCNKVLDKIADSNCSDPSYLTLRGSLVLDELYESDFTPKKTFDIRFDITNRND